MPKQKRLFLVTIYLIIFLFSLFSIFQIRYFLLGEGNLKGNGTFTLLGVTSTSISQTSFILIKLTLFVITACASFILMLSNFFMYDHPDFEKNLIKETDKEIRKAVLKRVKKIKEKDKALMDKEEEFLRLKKELQE